MLNVRSLNTKLIFIGLLTFAFICLYVYAGFYFTRHTMDEAIKINFAAQLRHRQFEMAWLIHKIIKTKDPELREPLLSDFEHDMNMFEKTIEGLKNGSEKLGIRPVEHKRCLTMLNNIIDIWNTGQKPALLQMLELPEDKAMALLDRYDSGIHAYVYKIDRFVKSVVDYHEMEMKRNEYFRISAIFFFTGVAVIIIIFVRRSILKPVIRLKEAISGIEKGNFDVRVDIKSRDEIGALSTSFNQMSQTLSKTFDDNKRLIKSLQKKEENLRRQQMALLELSRHETIGTGQLKAALTEITKTTSKTLDVERVNVWFFNDDHTKIQCLDSYEKSPDRHSEGDELAVKDYPSYFRALKEGRTVAARDAHTDPKTREFSRDYLSPHNITSMLDAPIRSGGEVAGVICCEHVGDNTRTWTGEEHNFAASVADLISIALEITERKRAEEELVGHTKELMALADSFNVISAGLLTENLYGTICNIVFRNFGVKMVWLGLIDNESHDVKPVAQSGFEEDYLSNIKITWDDSPYGMGPTGMAIKTKTPMVINDMDTDPAYAPWREKALKRGYRSSLAVPLMDSEAEVFGALNLYSSKPHFFTRKRLHIFQIFANYASVAIENRMLIEGLEEKIKERTDELERYGSRLHKLYEISLTTKANVREFADMILSELVELLDVDAAVIGRNTGGECQIYAATGRNCGFKEGDRFLPSEVYCGVVCDRKEPLVIDNNTELEEFKNHHAFVKYGVISYLGVPIYIGEELFGTLSTCNKSPHHYTEYDLILHQLLSKRLEFEFVKEKYQNELRSAMVQTEAANRAKSDFLANMSHELRTPLNSIMGFADLIMNDIAGHVNAEQKEYLKDIIDSSQHLLSLINDLLDLSKIEAGKMDLELSECSIKGIIDASIAMFKEKTIKHRIKIISRIADEIGTIIADERKLKQVIFNLLSNAIKFTPDDSSVLIQARRIHKGNVITGNETPSPVIASDGAPEQSHWPGAAGSAISEDDKEQLAWNDSLADYVEISVKDIGIGISKKDQEMLFKPFQQLSTVLTKEYAGTGLGLVLCKRLVELYGGRIWVESNEGKGSTFIFTIPEIDRRGRQ